MNQHNKKHKCVFSLAFTNLILIFIIISFLLFTSINAGIRINGDFWDFHTMMLIHLFHFYAKK